ncbi:hypothetical protein IT575_11960 [bacterium]|nr:hypothetical protein [bacterium]
MKRVMFLLALLLLLLAAACGAGTESGTVSDDFVPAPELSSPFGGSVDGASVERSASGFVLRLKSVPQQGAFLRVSLPDGLSIDRQAWQGNEQLLTLMIPTEQGADVGLVPLAGYSGGPVSVSASYGRAQRRVSIPPVGTSNIITDLVVEDLGSGSVGLSWIERNTGDYNFDGLVSVTDLTPIGIFFQSSIFRNLDSSPLRTEYWVDGNGDGLITVGDLTPIGQNYQANVSKYYISRNGGAPIEVLRSQVTPRTGLPPAYNIAVTGTPTDSFVVSAVDSQGNIGADSSGNTAVDLRATLTITGADLFNLDGNGSGAFGPGKFSSRVIAPIDVVDRSNVSGVAKLLADGVTTVVGGLTGGTRVYLDFRYAPTINLADGTPRAGASVRSASKDGVEDGDDDGTDDPPGNDSSGGTDDGEGDFDGLVNPLDLVLTSIPIDLPLDGAVDIDVDIQIEPNTAGSGYLVTVTAVITYPDGTTSTWSSQLVYAENLVRVDTDNDGDFSDELESIDDDRDCISDDDTATDIEDLAFEAAGYQRVEAEVSGRFLNIPGENHMRFNIETVIDGGDFPDLAELIVGERTFKFNADTEFENDIDAEPVDLLPEDLVAEDEVELDVYFYVDTQSNPIEPVLVLEPKNSLRLEQLKRTAHAI